MPKAISKPVNLSDLEPATIVRSSSALRWPGLIADYRVLDRGGMGSARGNSDHLLAMQVHRRIQCVQCFGQQRQTTVLVPGDLTLLPAGTPWRWDWDQQNVALDVRLPPAFVDKVASECNLHTVDLAFTPAFRFRDPWLAEILGELLHELWHADAASGVYVESLATALVVRLLRRLTPQARPATRAISLAAPVLDRVLRVIDDQLDTSLRVQALADVAGLSLFHFTRLFRQATGLAPHGYIAKKRVERARQFLLTGETLSLADIALRCGFADQSHFCRQFRNAHGMTPSAFRSQRRR